MREKAQWHSSISNTTVKYSACLPACLCGRHAVASVYKRKRGWQPLAEAMFRWQLPGTSWSALQMLPAYCARWYSYVHP